MDKTLQYTQLISNFNSAYNVAPDRQPFSTTYIPLSSSTIFSTFSNRPTSPLFQRCKSPPVRRPILTTESVPKFNFDLYKMDKTVDEYDDYIPPSSSIYRPLSPTSLNTIYHHPLHSPLSSPTLQSPSSLSKLRQINSELSRTLAYSDYPDPLSSTATATAPHYHIHHYPLSQYSPTKHRSASISDDDASSIEVPVPSNIRKARVAYKIHVPRRTQQKSTSNVDCSNEQIVVDLYPTREEAFVRQRRKDSDNQNPWIVKGKSLQHDSYSDTSARETPRDVYYGSKLIPSSRRSTQRPSSTKRHEHVRDPPRQSTSRRPSKSNKYLVRDEAESEPVSNRKLSSDRIKIRTDDPKLKKRIADTESKVKSTWEPMVTSVRKPTEREQKPIIPVQERTNETTPKPNIKSIPSEPQTPIKPSHEATPTNETTDGGQNKNKKQNQSDRSNSSGIRDKSPLPSPFHSGSSDSSSLHEVQGLPNSPSASEDEETPRPQLPTNPSTELPKSTVPEPDKGNKSTIKDNVLVHGNDTNTNHNQKPTPPPPPPPTTTTTQNNANNTPRVESTTPKPQPTLPRSPPNDQQPSTPKIQTEDDDENDAEVAQSFDIQKWLNDASKAILKRSPQDDTAVPSVPAPQPSPPPAQPQRNSPPRRKQQPPSPPPVENLYKPPFGPKRTEQIQPSSPSPAKTNNDENDAVDDFFS